MADATTPERDAWIAEQISAAGVQNTKANRDKYGKQWDARYLGGSSTDWRTYFKKLFPQFSTMVDGADGEQKAREVFGDLIDLLNQAAKGEFDLTTSAGLDAFDTRVFSTKFWTQTSTNKRKWIALSEQDKQDARDNRTPLIRKRYGFLNLTEEQVQRFTEYSLSTGVEEVALDYYVYNQVADGSKILRATPEAQEFVKIADSYNYKPIDLDAMIDSGITGQPYKSGRVMTLDGFRQQAKDYAKKLHPHLVQQLDSYTLSELFDPYREVASTVLERSPNDISISDPKFAWALTPNADGQMRSIGEWETKLMTDREYGFEYTNTANRQMRTLAANLLEIFGKTGGTL